MVSPIIDVIDWRTFQYNATQWPVRGVFNWRLDFHWESYTLLHDKDPDSAVRALRWVKGDISQCPHFPRYADMRQKQLVKVMLIVSDRSPVLGGEVFAIDRQFFQRVGGFDPGMLLWGEEQIELSIRVS